MCSPLRQPRLLSTAPGLWRILRCVVFPDCYAMDTESPHAQDNGFAQSPWMDMGGFHPSQHSPPMEYNGFQYGSVPLDPAYGVTIPPPYVPLPMTLPSNAWPSMLTPASQAPFHPPELPAGPVPIAPSVSPAAPVPPPRKSSASSSTPRRTLTDEDRRKMCLYHEENKTAKQTDIGGMYLSISPQSIKATA